MDWCLGIRHRADVERLCCLVGNVTTTDSEAEQHFNAVISGSKKHTIPAPTRCALCGNKGPHLTLALTRSSSCSVTQTSPSSTVQA
jgi:hypothetical protein